MKNNMHVAPGFFSQQTRMRLLLVSLSAILAGCAADQPPRRASVPAPVQMPSVPAAPQPAPAPPAAPSPAPLPATPPGPPQPPTQPAAAPIDKASLLRTWVDQQGRLYRVAAPLLINNTELCPQHVRNLLGFTAKTRYSYTDAFADTAQSALGLDERLRVMSVLPGSGAAQAGLQQDDILFAVEIEPLPTGPNAERDSAMIIGSELKGRSSVSLTVLRNGERSVLNIALTPSCAMVIELGNTDQAGIFADGQRVMVTRGMLNFVQSDEELAYVLAHAIAHNILTRQPRPDMKAVIDRLDTLTAESAGADNIDGILPYPQDIDHRARKLALYLLARAGYSLDGTLPFWQRLSAQFAANAGSQPPALHPVASQDFPALAETIGAIRTKQQLGVPLMPDQP